MSLIVNTEVATAITESLKVVAGAGLIVALIVAYLVSRRRDA